MVLKYPQQPSVLSKPDVVPACVYLGYCGMAPDLKRELLSKSESLTLGVGSDTPSICPDSLLIPSVTV